MSMQTITERELVENGVSSLPLTPTASPALGGRDYTPSEVKAAFDRLPRLIAARLNALLGAVTDGTLLADIPVSFGDGTLSLSELIALLGDHLVNPPVPDSAPASESGNTVTSGGVYAALAALRADVLSAAKTATDSALRAQKLCYDAATGALSLAAEEGKTAVDTATLPLPAMQETLALLRTLLGASVLSETVEDAFTTRPTAGGLSVVDEAPTTVHKITGASVASTNLVDLSTARDTKNGIGYSSINNTYTFSGTLASSYVQIDSFALPSHLRGKTLTFSQTTYFTDPADTGCIYIKVLKKVNGETTKMGEASRGKFTLTLDDADAEYAIVIQTGNWVGSTIDGTEQISFMVNEGSTALPYSDYFPGIRHAAFCGIASAGRNLIASLVDKTESADGITAAADPTDGTVTINGKPTAASFNMDVSVNFYLPRGTYTIYAPHRTMRFAGWMVKSRKSGATVGKIDWARLGGVVSDTFTVTEPGEYYIRFFAPIGYDYPAFDNYVETPMILPGALTENFPPLETYHADTSFALTTPVTLGKWDTIDVDAGKRIAGTVTETQDTPYTEEQLAQFDEYILSADGKTVIYRTAAPTETSLSVPNNYKAWHGGCEYITSDAAGGQNTDDLSLTVTQDYYVRAGGESA